MSFAPRYISGFFLNLSLLAWALFALVACIPIYERFTTEDLADIKERGKLQVITAYNANSYFIYKGEPMGYEYELVKRLADHLNVELEIIVSHDIESVPYLLNTGKGDLVAANIAVTGERVREIQFTEPLMLTRQVLVQRGQGPKLAPKTAEAKEGTILNRSAVTQKSEGKDEAAAHAEEPSVQAEFIEDAASVLAGEVQNTPTGTKGRRIIRNPIELLGKTVHVRKHSPFYQRLRHLEKEMGGKIDIRAVPGHVITEDLIRQVYLGKIDYTVADEPTALINKAYYGTLDVSTPIAFPQRIAWVVRPNAKHLLGAINDWIRQIKQDGTLVTIHNRYYRNPRAYRSRVTSEFYSESGDRISVFDDEIRAAAQSIGWDWRLLASLIYQESRFNPRARSWAGASGLMQLMPSTGHALGARNLFVPKENLKAGTRFLAQLDKRWTPIIKDPEERLNFVLASYNAGPGHVEDARYLAEYFGKDPNVWDGNVAEFMLKLSSPEYFTRRGVKYGYVRGEEPFNYVSEIRERYASYQKFFHDNPDDIQANEQESANPKEKDGHKSTPKKP